ncbi:hypothetical protein [Parvibaculum sp.]|uniref:hypothetical protein n=1 Tax=Parvibaculum sp. TaxID=2024848 RepID=UPI002C9A6C9A|nr:hypothetical protein [Parvibaculum sp.]HUD52614.1 hypothetical protein [Parvibaculum sp.]
MRIKAAMLKSIASFGCVATLLLTSAAFAGEPQKIDPYTGDPIIPEQQTQQGGQIETREVGRYPEPAQTATTQTTTRTTATGPAVHEQPKSVAEGGRTIGKDAGYAAKKVGSTTKEVTTTIGHTARDTTKAIGHGTRDFFHGIGDGLREGWNDVKE